MTRSVAGWKKLRMDELGEVIGGKQLSRDSHTGIKLPYLRVANVHDGFIDISDVKQMAFTPSETEVYQLKHGDVLLTEGQSLALVGRAAMFREEISGCCIQNSIIRLRPKNGIDASYAFFLCQHLFYDGQFQAIAKKTTSIAHLGVSRFASLTASVAPPREQLKITKILGTWDKALLSLERLISSKKRKYRLLREAILFGEKRHSDRRTKLHLVAEEQSIRNRTQLDRTRLYAVTKAEGMVPMRERVQGATINRCKVVERGWYAYNPMRLNIGSIARWEGAESVMTSGDYVVFSTNEDQLLSDYLDHLRRSDAWAGFVGAAGSGGVRVRIWFNDLGHFSFPLPPLAEQRRIADALSVADAELRLLREQHAALATQKRGLMQLLLTGKKRVRV